MSRQDPDKTPLQKPTRRVVRTTCPHCRKKIEIMPSGLLALHPVRGKWKSSMCRGSGQAVRMKRDTRARKH